MTAPTPAELRLGQVERTLDPIGRTTQERRAELLLLAEQAPDPETAQEYRDRAHNAEDDVARVLTHLRYARFVYGAAGSIHDMPARRWDAAIAALRAAGHVIDHTILIQGDRACNERGYVLRETTEAPAPTGGRHPMNRSDAAAGYDVESGAVLPPAPRAGDDYAPGAPGTVAELLTRDRIPWHLLDVPTMRTVRDEATAAGDTATADRAQRAIARRERVVRHDIIQRTITTGGTR